MFFIKRNNISYNTIMDNFDNLILIIDEIIDEGCLLIFNKIILNIKTIIKNSIIISYDPKVLIARSTMKDTESTNLPT